MTTKIPRWESKLWAYVGSGDGMHCPIYSYCRVRQTDSWCPDDNKQRLAQLIDDEQCNSSDCDFVGECAVCCRRIFKTVEMLAKKHLKNEGVRGPPVPTEFVSLLNQQQAIETRLLPLKVYHGAIWSLRNKWIIQLREGDTSAVKRFTLFHEVFHILAHCKTTPVFKKRGTEEGAFNELLADYFAACILMPREWVEEKWAEVSDLDQMAEIFDVPKPVMCIKLKTQGLI